MAATPVSSVTVGGITARLEDQGLWQGFNSCVTEMVVTKTGRKMFPKVEYRLEGMDPEKYYALFLHLRRVDDNRYKFVCGSWGQCGKAEQTDVFRQISHQEGTQTGATWMRNKVCFTNVKITNTPSDSPSKVCLTSMCKYVPVLTIYPADSVIPTVGDQKGMEFVLPIMQFIAVTAYQNHSITQLKIEHNPFAKGFREGSTSSDRKRSHSPSSPSTEERSPKTPKTSPNTPSQFTTPTVSLPTVSLPVSLPSFTTPFTSSLNSSNLKSPLSFPMSPLFPFYPNMYPQFLNPQFFFNLALNSAMGLPNPPAFNPQNPLSNCRLASEAEVPK